MSTVFTGNILNVPDFYFGKTKKGRLETSFVIGILQFGFFFLITAFKVFDVSNELKPLSNFYSVGFSNWCFLSANQISGLKHHFENPFQNQSFQLVVFLLWWFVSLAPLVSLFIILFRKCVSCILGGYSKRHSWEILNGSVLKQRSKVEKFFGLRKLLFLYQPLRLVFKMMLRIRPLIGCWTEWCMNHQQPIRDRIRNIIWKLL